MIAEYEIPKYEGDLGHPNLFVPVAEAIVDRKVELLMEHFGTQRSKGWFGQRRSRTDGAARRGPRIRIGWAEGSTSAN